MSVDEAMGAIHRWHLDAPSLPSPDSTLRAILERVAREAQGCRGEWFSKAAVDAARREGADSVRRILHGRIIHGDYGPQGDRCFVPRLTHFYNGDMTPEEWRTFTGDED